MGVARDAASAAGDAADSASAKIADAGGSGPQAVTQKAAGNPLAAGVIAFGLGWLASSLAPASDSERRAAAKVEANAGAVVDPLKESAQEVADNLQQPLQDADIAFAREKRHEEGRVRLVQRFDVKPFFHEAQLKNIDEFAQAVTESTFGIERMKGWKMKGD